MGRAAVRERRDGRDSVSLRVEMRAELKPMQQGLVALMAFWTAYVTADSALRQLDSVAGPDSESDILSTVVSMVDVTPQIPDGPVVQQYQKMIEKKKLSAEVERQQQLMGPMLARGDAKKIAKKREMEMLAEVEIKNRLSKRELSMKKKAKVEDQVEAARFQAANARRLERYEKWEHDKVVRNKERLGKLRAHTKGAYSMAKKLFKRKASTKKTAMKSMAEAKASQRQELRMGGDLQLKGDQINNKALSLLNDQLAAAMTEPTDDNIKFANDAYTKAAAAVTKEQVAFEEKQAQWKKKDKEDQELKEKKEADLHMKKLDLLVAKIKEEKDQKSQRKEKIEEDSQYNENREKRSKMLTAENAQKGNFTAELDTKEKEKKAAAPGELYNERDKKYTERSEKYSGAQGGDESTKYIAKRMKMRACEARAHAKMMLDQSDNKKAGTQSADTKKATAAKSDQESKKCKTEGGFSEERTEALKEDQAVRRYSLFRL